MRVLLALLLLTSTTATAQNWIDGSGGGSFSGGTLTTPLVLDATNTLCSQALSLSFSGDSNTGMQRTAADTVALCTGGAAGLTLTTSVLSAAGAVVAGSAGFRTTGSLDANNANQISLEFNGGFGVIRVEGPTSSSLAGFQLLFAESDGGGVIAPMSFTSAGAATLSAGLLVTGAAVKTTGGLDVNNANQTSIENDGTWGVLRVEGVNAGTVGKFQIRLAESDGGGILVPLSALANGNVGIGIEAPDFPLHVAGVASIARLHQSTSQTATCATGALALTPTAATVYIDAAGAACVVTLAEPAAAFLNDKITMIVATDPGGAGANKVTFPNVPDIHAGPLACTTTGLVLNGSYTVTFADVANDLLIGESCTLN